MASENESNSSGKMHQKVIASFQRRKSLQRKETARRHLIDSIHTRQGDMRHDVPCFSSERMKPEIKFPRVNSKERSVRGAEYLKIKSNIEGKTFRNRTATSPNMYIEIVDNSGHTDSVTRAGTSGYLRKSSSQNISLPEIIMEFNLETNTAADRGGVRMTSPSTEIYDDVRALGAPYEDLINKTKYNKFNPCRSRYRPVTPGLLESLKKLRMPSKVKTEQWLRSSQSSQKHLPGHVYKTENIDNTTNWIYDD